MTIDPTPVARPANLTDEQRANMPRLNPPGTPPTAPVMGKIGDNISGGRHTP